MNSVLKFKFMYRSINTASNWAPYIIMINGKSLLLAACGCIIWTVTSKVRHPSNGTCTKHNVKQKNCWEQQKNKTKNLVSAAISRQWADNAENRAGNWGKVTSTVRHKFSYTFGNNCYLHASLFIIYCMYVHGCSHLITRYAWEGSLTVSQKLRSFVN